MPARKQEIASDGCTANGIQQCATKGGTNKSSMLPTILHSKQSVSTYSVTCSVQYACIHCTECWTAGSFLAMTIAKIIDCIVYPLPIISSTAVQQAVLISVVERPCRHKCSKQLVHWPICISFRALLWYAQTSVCLKATYHEGQWAGGSGQAFRKSPIGSQARPQASTYTTAVLFHPSHSAYLASCGLFPGWSRPR